MGAYKELSAHFFKDIASKARELNYSDSNILILEGKERELRECYPNIYSNLLSCNHNRDKRTPFEYAQDLVASWLFEDCLVDTLANNGFQISLSGADSNREILVTSKVSANSDTLISMNGKMINMELMSDYTGYWSRNGKIDLRDEKYKKLKNSNSLFLGISTNDKKYVLIDFSSSVNYTYIPSHRFYGGKPCYSISINASELKNFTVENIVKEIKGYF